MRLQRKDDGIPISLGLTSIQMFDHTCTTIGGMLQLSRVYPNINPAGPDQSLIF